MAKRRRVLKAVLTFLGVLVLGLGGYVGWAYATFDGRIRPTPAEAPALTASTDPAIIERGKYLVYGPAHCSQCHSSDDRDTPEATKPEAPLSGGLEFAMGPMGTRYARNLTPDEQTGIGRYTDAQLARTLRTGITPDGEWSMLMTIAASNLSDDDIVAVLSYLRSRPAVRNAVPAGSWGPIAKLMGPVLPLTGRPGKGPAHVPAGDTPNLARGKYLAESVALCTGCHSKLDMSTLALTGPVAGGSDPDPSHADDSDMEYVAPNLTSHATGITGKWPEDAFVARLKAGRTMRTSIMPWEALQQLTDADARSIYRYLSSLPKVDNDVGPTYRKIGSHAK